MKNDRFKEKKNRRRFKIKNVSRIILDINSNRRKQQHDEFARQKLVSERRDHVNHREQQHDEFARRKLVSKRRDYKFEEHEKKHCRVIQ
jgi:hypothetical protein